MRLFLSDTCYEPLFALPKKIQTKVVNFQKKFRECTTANGMHLEPIAQFNDSSMRTARIDDNYRAVIGLIDDNAYLLYVGTHENAYNWGIRKKLVWNDHTQACQLVTIQQTTEIIVKTEEKESGVSYPYANITNDKWLKIGVPEELIEQVKLITSLDDLEPLEEYLPTDAFENIYVYLGKVESGLTGLSCHTGCNDNYVRILCIGIAACINGAGRTEGSTLTDVECLTHSFFIIDINHNYF